MRLCGAGFEERSTIVRSVGVQNSFYGNFYIGVVLHTSINTPSACTYARSIWQARSGSGMNIGCSGWRLAVALGNVNVC